MRRSIARTLVAVAASMSLLGLAGCEPSTLGGPTHIVQGGGSQQLVEPDPYEFVEARRGLAELAKVRVTAFESVEQTDDEAATYKVTIVNGSDREFFGANLRYEAKSGDAVAVGEMSIELPDSLKPGASATVDEVVLADWPDILTKEQIQESFRATSITDADGDAIYYEGMDQDAVKGR